MKNQLVHRIYTYHAQVTVYIPSAHNTYNSLYVTTIHAMYRDMVAMATHEQLHWHFSCHNELPPAASRRHDSSLILESSTYWYHNTEWVSLYTTDSMPDTIDIHSNCCSFNQPLAVWAMMCVCVCVCVEGSLPSLQLFLLLLLGVLAPAFFVAFPAYAGSLHYSFHPILSMLSY